MALDDESAVRIMQTLGLNYNPAISATKNFEMHIAKLNKELFETQAIAQSVAKSINNAFSTQLGNVKLPFNSQTIEDLRNSKIIVDQYGKVLSDLNVKIERTTRSQKELNQELAKARSVTQNEISSVSKNVNIFEQGFQRRAEWFLTGSIFFGITNGAKQAVESISEVGLGVTEIARVMEDSTFVFNDYRDALLNFGVDYASTFENTQDIALRWAQAGYNVEDSLKATQTSLLALNTAELDAKSSTEGLIGIMAQWKMDIVDLPLILDEINKTADDFTVTSQDLVDGLLRSSGAAKIMGLSLEETISLLTVMREASGRTGQEVGNALNSILSYVQRPVAIKTFEDLGIQVFADEAKTQFRNVMDIFDDVSAKWGKLSPEIQDGFVKAADDAGLYNEQLANAIGTQELWNDLQQRDLSQAAAGVYRRNYFIGMIERLSTAQDVLNNMTDASGYSMAENDKTMETLTKKYESFNAATQQLAVSMGDAGLEGILKSLVDGGTGAINMLNDMDPAIRNTVVLFAELTLGVVAAKQALKLLGVESTVTGVLSNGFAGLTKSIKEFNLAIKAGFVNNLPLLAAIGLATAIYTLASSVKKAKEEQEAFIQTTKDNIESLTEEKKGLQGLTSEYVSLKSKQDNLTATADEKLRLLDIQKELVSQYGVSITGINNEGQAYSDSIELIKLRTLALEQELEAEKAKLETAVKSKDMETVDQMSKDMEKRKKLIEDRLALEAKVNEQEEAKRNKAPFTVRDKITGNPIQDSNGQDVILNSGDKNYEEYWKGYLSELYYEQDQIDIALTDINTSIMAGSAERQQLLQNDTKSIINLLESNGKKVSDSSRAFAEEIAKSLASQPIDISTQRAELNKFIMELQSSDFDELTQKYKEFTSTGDASGIKNTSKAIMDLVGTFTTGKPELDNFYLTMETVYSDTIPKATTGTEYLRVSVNDLTETVSKGSGQIRELNNILNVLKTENTLSSETITDLILKYPELSKSIVKVGDSYTIEKSAIDAVRMVRINEQKDAVLAQSGITESVKLEISKRLANYGIELEAIKTLEDVRNASNRAFTGTYESAKDSFNLNKTLTDYVDAQNYIDSLITQLSSPSYGVSSGSGGSSGDSQNKQMQGALDLIEHRKKVSEETIKSIESEISELTRIKNQYAKTADEKAEMDEKIYQAEKKLSSERSKLSDSYFETEKSNIQELYDMTLISTQEQAELYRSLYQSRTGSLKDIQEMNKSIFDSYKSALSEELEDIKNAYDDRIDIIEKEADAKKKVQEEIIKGIELELDLLDKKEATRDYDKKMADLNEELAYWSVRTGEEARKKLADINEQISEAQHDREVELQKQSLEEKKQNAQDKINTIEDAAKEEKEKLQLAYSLVEKTFDTHGINMVALASTMSKNAFSEWQNNYFSKLQSAFMTGDTSSIGGLLDNASSDQKTINNNAKIYQLANSILGFKEKYEVNGDKSAAKSAIPYYNQLDSVSKSVSDQLHGMNYRQAKDYVDSLPKAHGGGKTLSYGAVYMKPGEVIFPPNLSKYMESLIDMARGNSGAQKGGTNNNKTINFNGPLFNSERTVIEGQSDESSLGNELKRAISNLL